MNLDHRKKCKNCDYCWHKEEKGPEECYKKKIEKYYLDDWKKNKLTNKKTSEEVGIADLVSEQKILCTKRVSLKYDDNPTPTFVQPSENKCMLIKEVDEKGFLKI